MIFSVEPDDEDGVECSVPDVDSSSDLQDVDEPGRTNRDLETKMKTKSYSLIFGS
jgi:hypothetical protein